MLENQGVGTVSMSVVEGLRNVPEETLDGFLHFSKETIRLQTEGKSDAHAATKLTAFVSMEIMEKLSLAQKLYSSRVLQLTYQPETFGLEMSTEQLVKNLADIGVKEYDQKDFEKLVGKLSLNGKMTVISRYAGGHLFSLYDERT